MNPALLVTLVLFIASVESAPRPAAPPPSASHCLAALRYYQKDWSQGPSHACREFSRLPHVQFLGLACIKSFWSTPALCRITARNYQDELLDHDSEFGHVFPRRFKSTDHMMRHFFLLQSCASCSLQSRMRQQAHRAQTGSRPDSIVEGHDL